MWPSIGSRINHCTPSVGPVPPIFSKQESRKNFKFGGNIALDKSNWGSKCEVKVTGNENVKIVFCLNLNEKWIHLCQTRPKVPDHSMHIFQYT